MHQRNRKRRFLDAPSIVTVTAVLASPRGSVAKHGRRRRRAVVAGRFRDPWRLWATAGVAGLTGAPQSVLAQSCSTTGIGPVKVTCNDPGGIITTTNATNTVSPNAATNDRIRSFHADLTAWACFCTKRAAIALVAVFFALIPLPRSAQAQAFETISPPSGYNFLGVAGVSADGLVVVGDIRPTGATSGDSQAFRWTTSTGLIGIGFLPGKDSSAALGVNADGSVIVGNSNLLKPRVIHSDGLHRPAWFRLSILIRVLRP
jgi:hypothetical protein